MYSGRLAYIAGWMLLLVGLAQGLPFVIALAQDEPEAAAIFARNAGVTCAFALLLILSFQGIHAVRDRRSAFLLPPLSFLLCGLFSSIPFYFLGEVSFSFAVFETISALSTSGATVFPVLADLPQSLIFWRSLLGWLGGLAFVLMCLAIYAPLNIGGAAIIRNALPHGEGAGLLARMRGIFHPLVRLYAVYSLAVIVLLWAVGEPFLTALNLGLSAISTTGFVPHDGPPGLNAGRLTEMVLMLAMVAGAINLTYYRYLTRLRLEMMRADPEIITFLGIIAFSLPILAFVLYTVPQMPEVRALWDGLFITISALTTTGFVPDGIVLFPLMGTIILMVLLSIGGASGSNGGGIKLFRFLIILRHARQELRRLAHPHRSDTRRYGDLVLEESEYNGVWLATFGLFFAFVLGLMALSALGMSYEDSSVVVITALASAGAIAPALAADLQGFWTLSGPQSWVVVILMIVGRLEVALFITVLTRSFWRR